MYVLLEPVTGKNRRYITGSVIASPDVHTLTSDSQEVMVGTLPVTFVGPDIEEALKIPISSSTAIPHSRQLNITNSTLSTFI